MFEYLEAVSGATWVDLGCMSSLEEVCHWAQTLRFKSRILVTVFSLYFMLVVQDVSFQLLFQLHDCLLLSCFPAKTDSDLYGTISQKPLFLL